MEPVGSYVDGDEARRSVLSSYRSPREREDRYWLHLLLFFLTLASTVYAGGTLVGRLIRFQELGTWWFVPDGLRFAFSLLLFLSVHEFGHYIAARVHRVSVSLPYYIPAPFIGIGTLGALIRIREPIPSMRKLFDIGVAGPLAGFVVALGVLVYALATLPPPTYVMDLPGHELLKFYVQQNERFPDQMLSAGPEEQGMTLVIGQTPLFWLLTQFFPNVPPMYEMYHYPLLFAGWLGLFFTALNLLPVGQLDGGHILYALVGPRWHALLARGFMMVLLLSGSIGFATDLVPTLYAYHEVLGELSWFILAGILYFYLSRVFEGDHRVIAPALLGLVLATLLAQYVGPALTQLGYYGWFIWSLLVVVLIRIDHPPVLYAEPLSPTRRVLGILSMVIFLLCFSLKPLYVV